MNPSTKVTYCIFCYNQSAYLEDAFRSAFAQDYPNMEIIFSDDCSSDDSYVVAGTLARAYRGPHQVTVRQSVANRGVVDHINDVAEIAAGDYLVITAADDVSAPTRTSRCLEALQSHNGSAAFCDGWDFAGVLDWEQFARMAGTGPKSAVLLDREAVFKVRGAVSAGALWVFRRDCFEAFGRMPATLMVEDSILPARAAILGRVLHLPQVLLARRAHPKSLSRTNEVHFSKNMGRLFQALLAHWECLRNDLAKAKSRGILDEEEEPHLLLLASRCIEAELVRIPIRYHPESYGTFADGMRNFRLLLALGDWWAAGSYLKRRFLRRA